jgi:hypothetical protein
MRWTPIDGVLYQDLPPVRCLLQCIEIERNEVVEEIALDLSSENVNFASKDIERMTVSSWWPRTGWQCSGPLFRGCFMSAF